MKIQAHPATQERWPDLEEAFRAKGCSMARGCWCMYYRLSGKQPPRRKGDTASERNRRRLSALVEAGPPPGLIAYDGGRPVGWVRMGPREVYANLEESPVMKAVDERPVWSIICVVVPSDREVSMKRLAAAFGGKSAQMMKPADAERITGYRVGGISPFGQKRKFTTAVETIAMELAEVYLNGGQRGLQVRLAPADAVKALDARVALLIADL